jgi:hypothetical protein
VNCGPPYPVNAIPVTANPICRIVVTACAYPPAAIDQINPSAMTQAVQEQQPDGSWRTLGFHCATVPTTPQVTPLLVRQQLERLVPRPGIGVAPPGGRTLVNIQTVLWVQTPGEQELPPLDLLGRRVELHIVVDHVDWDFGDGQRARTDGPEPAYRPADHCRTRTCPGYWGHTYAAAGTVSLTATTTWTATYRLDEGPEQPVPGTVAAPPQTRPLTVEQAHSVLVDPPH